ncbi:helix-turn-helix transcriptional regulator [Amycolatopsis sp. WQ 127309]|uniref:helix-turn-helix domain-containing protein n=1 Tax=Amycolatopsis sp. WQ 127309 TaxID=2932773 RepID=UPI002113647A|nr:helix-turn-helix transcriptional regulator [Amycolatopsis sp. WQ 127309]
MPPRGHRNNIPDGRPGGLDHQDNDLRSRRRRAWLRSPTENDSAKPPASTAPSAKHGPSAGSSCKKAPRPALSPPRTASQTGLAYDGARLAFDLGAEVRTLREQRNWTQTQLAERAGMTQSAIARFEAGGTTPTLPVLERIAAALQMRLSIAPTPA